MTDGFATKNDYCFIGYVDVGALVWPISRCYCSSNLSLHENGLVLVTSNVLRMCTDRLRIRIFVFRIIILYLYLLGARCVYLMTSERIRLRAVLKSRHSEYSLISWKF